MSSTNPHDAYFREMFSQPARLAGLLRSVLDPGAAASLDLDALMLDPERYLTEGLDDFEVDLVARVPVRPGGVAFVCVIVEHQSTPDEYMALRVLLYCTRIWEKLYRDAAGKAPPGGLPPIVPVVVYTGDRPWRAPRSLHGLMPALAAVPDLRAFVPNVTLCLDELRRVSDADLDARPLDVPGRIALTALKHGRDRRIGPHVAEWLRRLHAHDRGRPPALQDLSRLVEYLLFAQPHLQEWMMSWMTENPPRPVPGSIVDRWLHESEARGHAAGESEGRAAGEADGRAAGERSILRRQIQRRFGPLSAETEACLVAATLSDLDRWADAILDAACLEDVFR